MTSPRQYLLGTAFIVCAVSSSLATTDNAPTYLTFSDLVLLILAAVGVLALCELSKIDKAHEAAKREIDQ